MTSLWIQYALILSGFVMLAYTLWGFVNFFPFKAAGESTYGVRVAGTVIVGLMLIATSFLVGKKQKSHE